MQEALERALAKEHARDRSGAAKLYQTAINIATEGLSLEVPLSGLGPAHSTTAKWRSEMNDWQQHALTRWAHL